MRRRLGRAGSHGRDGRIPVLKHWINRCPPPPLCTGDWDGLDPMAEMAKLRHMKFDDWRSQKRKDVEWRKAVAEVRQQHLASQQRHAEKGGGQGAVERV